MSQMARGAVLLPAAMTENRRVASTGQLIALADPAYQNWLNTLDDDLTVSNGVLLYCHDTLPERNATFEVTDYAPGHLMIGDDGGGRGFLIACTGRPSPVFQVDHGSLQEDDFARVADTFIDWKAAGFALPPDQ